MTHPNETFIRSLYEAFDQGDLETIQAAFADEVQVHVPARSPIGGDYKGRDEVLGFFGQIIALSEGTFKTAVHDVLANDDHVVVLSRATASRAGKSLDAPNVEVFHVRDGKIAEAWFISGTPHEEDEFWS